MTDKPINPLNKLEEQMKVVFEEKENPKMLEICIDKNGSIENINNLPKGYGYYIKNIK